MPAFPTMSDEEANGCADLTDSEPEDIGWAKSKSKALLRRCLLANVIPETLEPRFVWEMHPKTHAKWTGKKHSSFTSGLSRLRNAIKRDRGRKDRDKAACDRDRDRLKELRKNEPDKGPVWHRHPAAELLKQDVDAKKHLTMKPEDLHKTKEECREFDAKVFRKHTCQEADSRPKRTIRFAKKSKAWKHPELHVEHPRLQDDCNGGLSHDCSVACKGRRAGNR